MVLKSSTVLSCFLPARFAPEKHHQHPPFDPKPLHRPSSPSPRPKRSSFNTFFAFSSKRQLPVLHLHQDLVPPHSVPGKWLSGTARADVHFISPNAIPPPLRSDEEEFYYSYYASRTPTASPDPTPDRPLAPDAQYDHHSFIRHPYAYSAPLHSWPHSRSPSLRHATSQPLQHHPLPALATSSSSHLGHHVSRSHPHLSQPQLKTSISTPNLTSTDIPLRRPHSVLRKRPPKPKERWLSAETWWDALLSPSPRFKVKQAPRRLNPTYDHLRVLDQGEPNGIFPGTFSSPPPVRPRAASVTANVRSTVPALSRSRSATDLNQPSTSIAVHYEPALETLADDPSPSPFHTPCKSVHVSLPDPFLSLEQVIDEGMAFDQQRAEWKRQASKSIGNKHTRSCSRARSKSLGERHAHPESSPEGTKSPFNLELLAARSLLGNQGTKPTVHVSRPTNPSSHSKSYSHSHSQSAYSSAHTSHSHSHVHSHSHSHSLSTSNSSKSSRNPRRHSRSGSWSRTALLKAGTLCGIAQDDSHLAGADEIALSASSVDVHATIHITAHTHAENAVAGPSKISPYPNVAIDQVGIAISSAPPLQEHTLPWPRHRGNKEGRLSWKHTHRSSEYAGPHPSAIDAHLPQLDVVSNVSLRHRLPPRPAIYPPISPIPHPYSSASGQPALASDKECEIAPSKATEDRAITQPSTGSTSYPHLSLSNADFEQFGVGEALVYASLPRPEPGAVSETRTTDLDGDGDGDDGLLPVAPPVAQSPSRDTVVIQPPHEELDTASITMNSPPSLTSSTIQMVMSAFNNPDDLDEFQDLFYKPEPVSEEGDASHEQHEATATNLSQAPAVPMDVHSSASSSPLTHLVRKLSEEAQQRHRDLSRTPSDTTYLDRPLSASHPSNESGSGIGTRFVFMDMQSSSPPPMDMDSSSHVRVPIQGRKASSTTTTTSTSELVAMVIPEDVHSSYTASVLENMSPEEENDTFGYPIKHARTEAIAPELMHTPLRVSTHLSIDEEGEDGIGEEDASGDDDRTFLRPAKRYGMFATADVAVRTSSATTMTEASHISGLFAFPLPPTTRPGEGSGSSLVSQSYLESTPSEREPERDDGSGDKNETVRVVMERGTDEGDEDDVEGGGEEEDPSGDVQAALQALRRRSRVGSLGSYRTTFGGSDDMDFITQLHQAQ